MPGWILGRRIADVQPSAWAWIVMVTLLAAAGVYLYHLTRATTFSSDEWQWVTGRRGDDLSTFLRPHNNHFSLVPLLIYRLLFATAGLGDYRPYRVMVIGFHLLCAALVFLYARRRVGPLPSVCSGALLLLLGAAWSDILWPFQVAWLISVAAGLGSLLMLDRRDRTGDVAACILLSVSLASSGIGLVVAIGVVVDVAFGRRDPRAAWIVALPIVLYGLWWFSYQQPTPTGPLQLMPHFFVNAASASFGAVAGQSGNALTGGPGTLLTWGRPLAVVAALLMTLRLISMRAVPPRGLTLLSMLVSFWLLTALTRTGFGLSQSWTSRYLYIDAVLLILLALELSRGLTLPRPARWLLALAVTAACVSGLGPMRDGALYLRTLGVLTRADLAALQIGHPLVGPDYVAHYLPDPLFQLRAGPYFAAVTALGSPAATPAQLTKDPEPARKLADEELIRMHRLRLSAVPGSDVRMGKEPPVSLVSGGKIAARGPCLTFVPPATAAASIGRRLQLAASSGGILLTARGGPAAVSVRRFADAFEPLGVVGADERLAVNIAPDLASQPWHVLIAPSARLTVCGLQ